MPPLQFTRPETNRYDGVSGVCQVRSSIESFRQFTVIEDTTEMLSVTGSGLSLCDGHSRREWMRIGSVGMAGLSLPTLLQARATATNASLDGAFGKAKSVILFGLTGGAPQHETFDPKPEAPENIRGEFGVINSRTSGLYVGELMPRTSALTDRIAVLRAVVTGDNAHSSSGYQMLTGVAHQPLNRESALPVAPNLAPCTGAIVRALKDRAGELPASVTLPEHIWNDGNFPWPGQDAGFLGRRFDPWLMKCDPNQNSFQVGGMQPLANMTEVRYDGRRSLLQQMDARLGALKNSSTIAKYDLYSQQAINLVAGDRGRSAFDLNQETPAMRDRYGRSRYAQSALLARRLIEAGVSLVQLNWTRIKDKPNQGGWDTHKQHSESLKSFLMPMMDQAYSALLEDLDERGLLDETLVVWFGEFGHTPKFNGNAGRDHWGHCFSVALAGGGIRGGVVHGSSDAQAAYPVDGRVAPKDLIATIFHCLGFAPETEIRDPFGRPLPISRGSVIREIV